MGLLTSVPFAVLQLTALAVLAALGIRGLPLQGLLALICLSTVATAWKRRPYDRARLGFLLVHGGAALLLLGLLGPRPLAWAGAASLGLGAPWMFYLKPRLRPKPSTAPAWERGTLQGTRILFLAAGAASLAPLASGAPPPAWALTSWLALAVALHLHHVKGWKGRRAQLAGMVSWGLCLASYLALKP